MSDGKPIATITHRENGEVEIVDHVNGTIKDLEPGVKLTLYITRSGCLLPALLLLLFVALFVGCTPPSSAPSSESDSPVYYWHDTDHGVSCWLYGNGGTYGKAISCLPDGALMTCTVEALGTTCLVPPEVSE